MHFKQVLSLALASTASAQSLSDALLSQNSSLSTLNTFLQSTGLLTSLGSLQNVTLLAPNNDALSALMSSNASFLSDPGAVSAFLQYHILNGSYPAGSFTNQSKFIHTALRNSIYANLTGGQVVEARNFSGGVEFFSALKQNVTVVTPNINFTGGTIHIINGYLSIPGNISNTLSNANLTAAAGALRASNLETTVGAFKNVTIFAPNNDAFNSVGSVVANLSTTDLVNLMGYHVVNKAVAYSTDLKNETLTTSNGQTLTISVINGTAYVNAAKVTIPDLLTSNGVIHVIDQVLNPANSTATPDPSATTAIPAFSGASTATGVPFTSGIATPTTTFPAATTGGSATSSSKAAAIPMKTGAIGAAALFGGAAMLANL